jgi:hypothetical protein
VFGCVCWPNLRPYNAHKLSFRSVRCVFLGYSSRHKGFKCLEPSTGRVYISRDVTFYESVFPFANLHQNAGARLRKEILLLPNHLLNTGRGDVDCIDSNITNDHTNPGTQNIVEDELYQDAQEDAEDPGIFLQVDPPAGSGAGSQADPPGTPDGSTTPGASPPSTHGGGQTSRSHLRRPLTLSARRCSRQTVRDPLRRRHLHLYRLLCHTDRLLPDLLRNLIWCPLLHLLQHLGHALGCKAILLNLKLLLMGVLDGATHV